MKLIVAKDNLFKMLAKVNSVISGKVTTSEIYSCVLMETQGDRIQLTGTDGEVTVMGWIPAQIETDGQLAIPAKKFMDVVRDWRHETITIENKDHNGVFTSGKSNYRLSGYDPTLYPERPETVENFDYEIPAKIIGNVIETVSFAVAVDDPRPAFMGIYWVMKPNGFDLVATDTHKLARVFYKVEPIKRGAMDTNRDAIVPPKALRLLTKLENEEMPMLYVKFETNHMVLKVQDFMVYTNLLRGPFPEYERVIPFNNETVAEVSVNELKQALRSVSQLSNLNTHLVKFNFTEETLGMSGMNIESGDEATDEIPIQFKGDALQIGFNSEYILTILKALDCEKVIFKLKLSNTATLVIPSEQPENQEIQYVVMPLKFQEV